MPSTYYVDEVNGSDGDTGASVGHAFATLAHAVGVAVSGDTVNLVGDFNEWVARADFDLAGFTAGVLFAYTAPTEGQRYLLALANGGVVLDEVLNGSILEYRASVGQSNMPARTALDTTDYIFGSHYDSGSGLWTTSKITLANFVVSVLDVMGFGDLAFEDVAGPTKGGTGLTSCIAGDLFKGSGANTVDKLAGPTGAAAKFLRGIGTGSAFSAMTWGAVTGADLDDAGVALTKLALQADQTVLANISGDVASPTAVALTQFYVLNASTGHLEGTDGNGNVIGLYSADGNILTAYLNGSPINLGSLT